jgi:hypothetical protein
VNTHKGWKQLLHKVHSGLGWGTRLGKPLCCEEVEGDLRVAGGGWSRERVRTRVGNEVYEVSSVGVMPRSPGESAWPAV